MALWKWTMKNRKCGRMRECKANKRAKKRLEITPTKSGGTVVALLYMQIQETHRISQEISAFFYSFCDLLDFIWESNENLSSRADCIKI